MDFVKQNKKICIALKKSAKKLVFFQSNLNKFLLRAVKKLYILYEIGFSPKMWPQLLHLLAIHQIIRPF